MRKLLLLGVIIPLFLSCTTEDPNYFEEKFSIDSGNTGQSYEMTIYRPSQLDANQQHPFVFLLDGHWHYNQVLKDLQALQSSGGAADIILVGIAYEGLNPNGLAGYGRISELRVDDFTATKNNPEDQLGGKSVAFRDFIKDELLPELQSKYPEDPSQRTVMGHSLGGYFGVWEMFTYSDSSLFKNVHAGSPALWWDDGDLMSLEENFAGNGSRVLPFHFHTTMGTMETVVWNTFFDEFEERLGDRNYDELEYVFERYPRGHAANAEPGFASALNIFFPAE